MLKKLLVFFIISIISMVSFSGCHQMGKWAGEGAEEVEEGAEEFEEGYEEGKD